MAASMTGFRARLRRSLIRSRLLATLLAALLMTTVCATAGIAAETKSDDTAADDGPPVGLYTLKRSGLTKKIVGELFRRWNVKEANEKIHLAPEAKQGESAPTSEGDRYQWEVYVPESYDGSVPHGIIAYIHSNENGPLLFKKWMPVLEKHNLIWIVGLKAGNEVDPVIRHAMALEGVYQLRKQYNIDGDRIYTAGISGGGRAAGILMIMFSDIFDGGWTICGINPIASSATAKQLKVAKTRNRYVFMTGDGDYNRKQVKQVFEQYQQQGFARTKYIQVPGLDHAQPAEGEPVEQAIRFLDAPLTAQAKKTFTSAESNYKRNKFARAIIGFEKAVAHGGDAKFVETAKERLEELRERYKKELSHMNNAVETDDLSAAHKQLTKFRKKWASVAEKDVARLSATLKKYRKEGRPERVEPVEEDVTKVASNDSSSDAKDRDGKDGDGKDADTPDDSPSDYGGLGELPEVGEKLGQGKGSIAMPSNKPFNEDALPGHPSKFVDEKGLAGFKIDGDYKLIPGQGILIPAGDDTTFVSEATFKYPLKVVVMIGAIPPDVRDIDIQVADVRFRWGTHNNTRSFLRMGGERVQTPHLPIAPQQLSTVSISIFDDRTVEIEIDRQVVHRAIAPEGTSLNGLLEIGGAGRHLVHGLVVYAKIDGDEEARGDAAEDAEAESDDTKPDEDADAESDDTKAGSDDDADNNDKTDGDE